MDTPQLIIQTENGTERLQLSKNVSWTFGRSKTNTVRIGDPNISRHHAKLEIVQERHYYFVDLNSRNGSLVNGQRITQPLLLKHGDHISIGNVVMVFHHSHITLSGVPILRPAKQVLMLQGSAIQGKIWQEILLSQNASVIWEVSSTQLSKRIALNATANTLPSVLLIDRKAYGGNLYEFCAGCRQTYPQLSIFVIDSACHNIPDNERQVAIEQGCKNLFPALPKHNLVNHASEIAAQVNEVLSAMDSPSIHPQQLLPTLKTLEDLMRQAQSFVPLVSSIPDSEGGISTALNLNDSA